MPALWLSFRASAVPEWSVAAALALAAAGCLPPPVPEDDPVQFQDMTAAAGLEAFVHVNGASGAAWEPEIMGGGAAFLDYDGDEWMDLLLVGGGSFREAEFRDVPAVWLYRNQGDGTFRLVNEEVGLEGVRTYGMGLAVADYDNDGDADFLLTSLYENLLFRNDAGPRPGLRTFTEVGAESGIGARRDWSTSAVFFDADRDGWLDLFVANYLLWSPETDRNCEYRGRKGYCTPDESSGVPDRFYRNNGNGTFSDRTEEAGFYATVSPRRMKGLGVVELDFNDDGWPDLFVANDTERDLLYVNRGDGTFDERGVEMAVAYSAEGIARAGMGADVGVVDSSGRPTIFVGNFSRESVGVYRYDEAGFFESRDVSSRVSVPTNHTLTFGLFLFDVELDGDLDLFLANGHVQEFVHEKTPGTSFRQPAQLLANDGNGVFMEIGAGRSPFDQQFVGRGAAYADYDRDGDLDVVITENGGPVRLWQNRNRSAQSVRLVLHGAPPSNRDAYGSVVTARVGDRRIVRRLHGGSSYLSQSEPVVTIGVAGEAVVEELTIRWPDGTHQRMGAVPAGAEVHVLQGREDVSTQQLARGR